MTHAHTLWFFKTKTFYPRPKTKSKLSRSWKFWFFRISQWPVDRQSTGTRPTCTVFVHVRISRPESTDTRPTQTCCSLENASRPDRSTDSSFQKSGRLTSRPVAATVRKMTVGRSTGGRPPALTEPQRLYFLAAYKLGFCHLFWG